MADDRPRTLPVQGIVNRLVQGLSRVPLVSRLIGRNLIILYVVGRKTGKRYTVPVAYTRHDGALLVGSPFGWGRNLRTGEPIEVRFMGRRRPADVVVVSDEDAVVADYAVIARDNHRFGAFNAIGYDAGGNPDPADLHRAWAAGARVFRLTPR
ncbi:nitroreductase family deazaflavin-dependent oxidoreductase [Couchioplanes caeruleus]|uniref:nitroreductase family deazaflavin-dependent oxidoreductase n=1 Tax=Couchioplanes caeruleus TaxID=56438 RepID=UPI00201C5C13|nr:nitroreductase family deazaflavin-dependent oxidoreductase [Couchioplanes caeruleus]UQU62814.1 nitroreductase family deazaflavin-dependent oxidoreductase [Couchioplanes caeruleus]